VSTSEQANKMDSLIADLANDHGRAHQHARESLVAIGRPAVGPLMQALQHKDWRMRWGAAKALGQIADPVAANALVKTLEDQREGVRWLAGERIQAILTTAPGNGAPIGGLKVVAKSGWFAARPSGTENIYKIYAESFRGPDHLKCIREEAQTIVSDTLAAQ